MGLVTNLSELPAEHVDMLLVVDQKWSELVEKRRKDEAAKANRGKRGGGRRLGGKRGR